MNCDCVSRVNGKLKDQNLVLDISILFGDKMQTCEDMITIGTHWLDKSKAKRGKRPTPILVTFCPFCGTKAAKEKATKAA